MWVTKRMIQYPPVGPLWGSELPARAEILGGETTGEHPNAAQLPGAARLPSPAGARRAGRARARANG